MPADRIVVLVVDDEILVRLTMAEELEDAGFDVVGAMGGTQAIAVLERDHRIEVVVSDIRMPGPIDGLALSRTLAARWPGTKVILTSGAGDTKQEDVPPGGRYIAKHYEIRQLVATIKSMVFGYVV